MSRCDRNLRGEEGLARAGVWWWRGSGRYVGMGHVTEEWASRYGGLAAWVEGEAYLQLHLHRPVQCGGDGSRWGRLQASLVLAGGASWGQDGAEREKRGTGWCLGP
jgi:hypothetical protein